MGVSHWTIYGVAVLMITPTLIKSLRPGEVVRDTLIPGLHIKGHKTGQSWMLYYRSKEGIKRRPKLGDSQVLTLAQARDIARTMLAQIAAGQDPSQENREPTVDELWERVVLACYASGKQWDKEAQRLYDAHIRKTSFAAAKIRTVSPAILWALREKMSATPVEFNRLLAVLAKAFKMAERWDLRMAGTNPCKKIDKYRETSRNRFATVEELRRLGVLLAREEQTDPYGVAFIRLMLLTGARPSELAKANWLHMEPYRLQLPDGKTGARTIHLSETARKLILELSVRADGLIVGPQPTVLWRRLRKQIGCPDLWLRDLRRTFATIGLSHGIGVGILSELLGHRSAQTTKIYAKLMMPTVLRASVEVVADYIQTTLTSDFSSEDRMPAPQPDQASPSR